LDNGIEQQLKIFERHTAQPLSVSILIDTSGSTAKDLKEEVESVSRFARALFNEGNPDDSAALYSFNWEVRLQVGFTRRVERLQQRLKALKGEAGTSLYDALYLASGELRDRDGRHVIVVVTDGGDTTSSMNYHQALQAVHQADAVAYAILIMPITNDAGRNTGGENALTGITTGTGGRVFMPSLGFGLDAAFSEILKELRTQYLLAYYPKNRGESKSGFHRVEVKVKQSGLRVLSRTGYYEGTLSK
jgi:Ca-activated chloride channel family protein